MTPSEMNRELEHIEKNLRMSAEKCRERAAMLDKQADRVSELYKKNK